jgi:hypothetical protein
MRHIQKVIRLILSCILLYFVWRNSHWSIAVSITLLTFSNEIQVLLYDQLKESVERVKMLTKTNTFDISRKLDR